MRMTSEEFGDSLVGAYLSADYHSFSLKATAATICPEGHTIEVFGPEWERTEEDGKIVWQKKKPYWTVEEDFDDSYSVTSWNFTACTYALPDAKERAENLAAELNRDYPNGLPK